MTSAVVTSAFKHTFSPTYVPTARPSTALPTARPTVSPSAAPSATPTVAATTYTNSVQQLANASTSPYWSLLSLLLLCFCIPLCIYYMQKGKKKNKANEDDATGMSV